MNTTKRKVRIGISGSYGGMNLGDEAILQCIVGQLRESVSAEITVFSKNPGHTLKMHDVDRAIAARSLSRDELAPELERLDLFILGGGGILFDGLAQHFMREVSLAHDKGVPMMTYAIGAGPLKTPENQKLVSDNLNKVSVITVRERSAKKVLEEAGVDSEIIITADPAILLNPEPLSEEALCQEGIDMRRRLIGISVREPGQAAPDIDDNHYHALLANAADYMVERYNADIVFVPMERKTYDLQHSHAIMAQMLRPEHAGVLKGEYTPGQMLELMRYFSFAVGMRLHFLIFAALQNVPFVALPYASKVSGFLESLNAETPPIQLVNAGRVIAHIDHLWDSRETLVTRIKNTLPELKRRARVSNELALRLLREKHPEMAGVNP